MSRKLVLGPNSWDCDWIGHPNGATEPLEILIRDARERVEVIAEASPSGLSYEYDDYAVIRLDGALYLLHTAGCSCPSPTETWGVMSGPTSSAEELLAVMRAAEAWRGDRETEVETELRKQLAAEGVL